MSGSICSQPVIPAKSRAVVKPDRTASSSIRKDGWCSVSTVIAAWRAWMHLSPIPSRISRHLPFAIRANDSIVPNDAVFRSNGDLYFTDPAYGLEKQWEDPLREIPFAGVYRRAAAGEVSLLTSDMTRPNGLAFSPDEKRLYVAQSDEKAAIWRVFDVKPDGTIDNGRVLFDATSMVGARKGLPDGLKIDTDGNLWATGPGGVMVLSPEGKHLGTIMTGQATSNCAFGDDGRTLYMTADDYIMRVKVKAKGMGF